MSARYGLCALALFGWAGCGMLESAKSKATGAVSDPNQAAALAGSAKDAAAKIQDLRQDLTPENEYYVGRAVATNILAKHDYQYRDRDAIAQGRLLGITAYVASVGSLVAAAALETTRDGDRPAPLAGFHFTVVDSQEINAFATPGGFVFITTAALKTARNEDELACVLAHEVAHVVRGHALGTIKKSRYANISKDALKASGALSPEQLGALTELLEKAIDDMVEAFFVKGYSRDTEFEADQVGLALCARAGYNPQAMTSYLGTLKAKQKTGSGGFFQTHPAAQDRIDKLSPQVAAAGGSAATPPIRVRRFATATRSL
jgi:predicted Zn-dependent protease